MQPEEQKTEDIILGFFLVQISLLDFRIRYTRRAS